MMSPRPALVLSFLLLGLVPACAANPSSAPSTAAPAAGSPPDAVSIELDATIDPASLVADPGRSEADRALDPGRRPVELLEWLQLRPGMRVAELCAGSGYTAELLARAVGPTGRVYGQNPQVVLDRYAEAPWSERLERPVMHPVVRVDRELDEPLPPEARDLDLVVFILFYHDSVWMQIDRDRMNRAVFDALRPGGRYVVIDHSARAGSGVDDTETLHRIEEAVVRREVIEAGFGEPTASGFLRRDDDSRDWNAAPRAAGDRRGESDRFALMFTKPG